MTELLMVSGEQWTVNSEQPNTYNNFQVRSTMQY